MIGGCKIWRGRITAGAMPWKGMTRKGQVSSTLTPSALDIIIGIMPQKGMTRKGQGA